MRERHVELAQVEEVDGFWMFEQLRLLQDPYKKFHHLQFFLSYLVVGQLATLPYT